MLEKKSDVSLREMLHSCRLSASIEATISRRISKVKVRMCKAALILTNHRRQAIGGMARAWVMFNLQMMPKLLANFGSCVESLPRHFNNLDTVQNQYCWLVHALPDSIPITHAFVQSQGWASWVQAPHMGGEDIPGEQVQTSSRKKYPRYILEEQMKNDQGGLTEKVTTVWQEVGLSDGC